MTQKYILMDCYMVVKQTFEYKTKGIYHQDSLNREICSSPSKMSMQNSIILVLLTHNLEKWVTYWITPAKDFSIIWSINCNISVIGSNIQCDVIKQPGETVSAS